MDVADLPELEELLGLAKRPAVRALLEDAVRRVKAGKEGSARQPEVEREPQKFLAPPQSLAFEQLSSYFWSDDGDFITVGVELKGIGLFEEKESNVKAVFEPERVQVLVLGFEGRNYKFLLADLAHPISPSKSKRLVRSNRIVLKLAKEGPASWYKLVEKKKDKPPKVEEGEDPGASIMKMMKNMYDEGDDEMKRTIAKAWEESQRKQMQGGGLDRLGDDF